MAETKKLKLKEINERWKECKSRCSAIKNEKKKNKTFKSFYLSLVESVSLVPPCYPEVLKTMQTEKWHIAINIH